jgi:hypothetical protein
METGRLTIQLCFFFFVQMMNYLVKLTPSPLSVAQHVLVFNYGQVSYSCNIQSEWIIRLHYEILNSCKISKLKRDIPEDHRTIVFPKEIDRAVWRCILRALTREVHSYPGPRSKIIWTNFAQRYRGDFTHGIPEKQHCLWSIDRNACYYEHMPKEKPPPN